MVNRIVATALCVFLALIGSAASAQETPDEGVVILRFDTFNTEQEVMDAFYAYLHDAVEQKSGIFVKPGGDATIGDLILTAGCEAATAECLSGLADFIDGDRLIFGSVQYSDGVHLISLRMFDFSEGEFVADLPDETIEGEPSQISDDLEAVIDGFLYGEVGEVFVEVVGAEGATVVFNGEPRGQAPIRLENLPLGQQVIAVRTPEGAEKKRTVILRQGKESKVLFDMSDSAVADVAAPRGGEPNTAYVVPGWASLGLGVGALIAGAVGTAQLKSAEGQAEELVCGERLCEGVSASRAFSLQSDMDKGRTLQAAGLSLGALGVSLGGYLLYQAYWGQSVESEPAATEQARRIRWGVRPSTQGVALDLSVDF